MNLWVLTLKRDELLTAFEPQSTSVSLLAPVKTKVEDGLISGLDKGCVSLIWLNRPAQIDKPPLMVVPQGELADFLAWTSTFIKQVRPLTAFTRVIEFKDWESTFAEEMSSSSDTLDGLVSALSGLIVAEALGGLSSSANARELSIFSCESTYFFALARAVFVRLPATRLRQLHKDWTNLRTITKQATKDIPLETVELIQETIIALAKPALIAASKDKSLITVACRELMEHGEISSRNWIELAEGHSDLQFAPAEMRASRERRVGFLDKVFRNDITSKEPVRMFLLGYLLSLFDNGSNINTQFLPATAMWSSILLWHGFTAGLQKGTTIEFAAGGLGRRISRDVLRQEDLISHPRADINLDELKMLHDVMHPLDELSTEYPNVLTVELAPRVCSVVRWPVRSRGTHQATTSTTGEHEQWRNQQRQLFHETEDNERQKLLAELGNTLERARSIQQRLYSFETEPDPSRKKNERRRKY